MILFGVLSTSLVLLAGLFVVPFLWRGLSVGPDVGSGHKWRAIAVLLTLFVATAGIYFRVGTPAALTQTAENATSPSQPTPEQIEGMVNGLAQRLKDQPNDVKGWRMLARSYETMGRFEDAAGAYRQILSRQTPDADLLTDYAVVLGMAQGQTLVGEPEAMLAKALALNPQHIQALALSGSAAFERKNYAQAISSWQTLLTHVPPDASMRKSIQANIDKARALKDGP